MNLQAGPLGLVSSLGLVSKIILLFLFGFSVLSWAIILYKLKVYRRSDAEDQRFLSSVAKLNDVEEMRRQARRAGESPSAAVLLSLLDRLPDMPEAGGKPQKDNPGTSEVNPLDRHYLERSMAYIVQGQLSKMESYLPFLATTGNITPFIGLLGTVLGIIDSFREIGQQGTASIGAVAPGVAEALVATAMGLFTAIPAVVAYNYFLSRIRRMSFRLETFSVEVLNSLLRRVGARGATS